jgi:hypothetical protein
MKQLELVGTLLREARLPRDQRRAARFERRVEAELRAQRDAHDEKLARLAAVEAERRRVHSGGTTGYGGGPGL